MPYARIAAQSAACDMALKALVKSTSTLYTLFPLAIASRLIHSSFVRFMSALLPCLPPDWPGARIPAFSTMFLSRALRMCITSWLVQLSRVTGWYN
jgi:hypothetical protein